VQLHGRETPDVALWLKERVPMVIQAFSAGDERVRRATEYGADLVLLDGPSPGSGRVFDWALAGEVPPGQRFLIAGGLTPDNVAAAISRAHPWGVDVVSGVEKAPGSKDPIRLREFIAAVRASEAAEAAESAQWGSGPVDDDGDTGVYDWQEDQ
jgi:phosphoribosylanthranilate isomerase